VVLAWLMGGELPVIPLVGASLVAQLEESLAAVDLELTAAQWARLDEAHCLGALVPWCLVPWCLGALVLGALVRLVRPLRCDAARADPRMQLFGLEVLYS
jgi:hypothetical protein